LIISDNQFILVNFTALRLIFGLKIRIVKTASNANAVRYHELYRIEQAFRIAQSDLQTKPIFHFKEEPIKLHILICFIALVISKHIELQTSLSIKKFIDEARKIVDGQIRNLMTNKVVQVKAEPTTLMKKIIAKLSPPH